MYISAYYYYIIIYVLYIKEMCSDITSTDTITSCPGHYYVQEIHWSPDTGMTSRSCICTDALDGVLGTGMRSRSCIGLPRGSIVQG